MTTYCSGLLCAQCDSGWFSGKLVRSTSVVHANNYHVCVQSALECKTCANASLLVSVAIASTLGVYAIGVLLGQRAGSRIDTQDEDPTSENAEVASIAALLV